MIKKPEMLSDETLVQLYGMDISVRWGELDTVILSACVTGNLMGNLLCICFTSNVLPDTSIELLQTLVLMRCEYLVGIGKLSKRSKYDGMIQVYHTENKEDVDANLSELIESEDTRALAEMFPGKWINIKESGQMWYRITV